MTARTPEPRHAHLAQRLMIDEATDPNVTSSCIEMTSPLQTRRPTRDPPEFPQ